MKKLLVLLVVVVLGAAVYRTLARPHDLRGARHAHQHGTPDHWPPVVRKPGAKVTSTAPAA